MSQSRSHFANDDANRIRLLAHVDMGEAQQEQQRHALAAANRRAAAELEAEEQAENEQGAKAAAQGEDLDLEADDDDEEPEETDIMRRELAELQQRVVELQQAVESFAQNSPAPLRISPDGDAMCRPVRRDPRRAPRSRYA